MLLWLWKALCDVAQSGGLLCSVEEREQIPVLGIPVLSCLVGLFPFMLPLFVPLVYLYGAYECCWESNKEH